MKVVDAAGDGVVLFDMDGVILDGRGTEAAVHARALDDVLEERDLEIDDDLRGALATYEYDDAFRAACGRLDVDPDALFSAREERSAKRTVSRLAAGVRTLCPDVDALEPIAERATVGLVSNNYHPTVEFVVDHFRLTEFEYVRGRDLGPDGFDRRKPDPYYLNEALDALDASGGVYVGDRATDVIAAERAGLESVLVRREHNAALDLDAEPTVEVGSLHELVDLLAPAGRADDGRRR
ncbi:HAD family hydrolase [Halorubrum aethiopicum]|uniref:HAD family hydrolase n=1 Tax=Halorubrum aethiopicum TaxID=1758255 RepID=UPI00082F2D4C|nr:HAD-IA family hydrolase [Halorubrum aethiopicum]